MAALRRPEGGPGGTDTAAGPPPRHPGARTPVATSGPSGDVRVDAPQGRHDRSRRWPRVLDRPRRVLQPRHERTVVQPPRRLRPRPVRRPRTSPRLRRSRRLGAQRTDRLQRAALRHLPRWQVSPPTPGTVLGHVDSSRWVISVREPAREGAPSGGGADRWAGAATYLLWAYFGRPSTERQARPQGPSFVGANLLTRRVD